MSDKIEVRGHILKISAGFTVLEVLIALVILSMSLSVLYETSSNSLSNVAFARDTSEATALAQSILTQLGTVIPVRPGEIGGDFGNGQTWELNQTLLAGSSNSSALQRYRARVEVEWSDGQRRSVSLTTLRLAPAQSEQ